ncbi:MAG TPA: hypothetical protein DDX39_11245 [Bacteroidales bacterium]|nr:MAG: hypothetical protein A2W98_13840 [Bacteroidetes bacterium GWF2_33_38]OFY90989.1 MAG: hypothetical protein A2236_03475 [Bacteroidetes bacterium RIFOXYA2_FULL_33_7]HBF89206.1 hypothetical protein [Bacteroidales bacterium]
MESTYKHIDLTYVTEIADGNNDLIRELVTIFKSQVIEYRAEFYLHLNNENWESLGALAHKAKSSVAVMGIKILAADLKRLELLAREAKDISVYPEIVKSFDIITNEAVVELDDYVSKLD